MNHLIRTLLLALTFGLVSCGPVNSRVSMTATSKSQRGSNIRWDSIALDQTQPKDIAFTASPDDHSYMIHVTRFDQKPVDYHWSIPVSHDVYKPIEAIFLNLVQVKADPGGAPQTVFSYQSLDEAEVYAMPAFNSQEFGTLGDLIKATHAAFENQ